MTPKTPYDVIIIGGSYAGLSAAMALGRSLRSVLIIDSGKPCNRQTPHSHNFITQDGEKPDVIAAKAKEQVLKYNTVSFVSDLAVSGEKVEGGFTITTQSGDTYEARKLICATGIKDNLPDIPGFAACWGTTIVHCPYCHGYELKDKKTGILANGERAFHLAGLVHNLTKDLAVLTAGKAALTSEQMAKLDQHQINIIETAITEIIHNGAQIEAVVFSDGSRLRLEALYAAVPFTQHSDIPASLGCELTEHGYIKVDAFQKSTVPGVYACGDNAAMMRSVANAVYSGNVTGAMVNKDLVDEMF